MDEYWSTDFCSPNLEDEKFVVENSVSNKIGSFCFSFSFKIFITPSKESLAETLSGNNFEIFPFQTIFCLKHPNNIFSFPLTEVNKWILGRLMKYFLQSNCTLCSPKQFSTYIWSRAMPRCHSVPIWCVLYTCWNQQTEWQDFYLVGWAKFQMDKNLEPE